MFPDPALLSDRDEALRVRLADVGVPLFHAAPSPRRETLEGEALADLVRSLALSGDARLNASIPCLLAVQDGEAASRAVEAVAADPALRERLGFVYRLARALVVSRTPALQRLFGHAPDLPPLAFEPADLPDPSLLLGEATLFEASERARESRQPNVAGGTERMFDTWLRLLAVARR